LAKEKIELSAEETNPVQAMFNAVAPRYDLLNRLLSIGIDRHWRKVAVREFEQVENKKYLDMATGTADVALEFAKIHSKASQIIGIDFSVSMLKLGRQKIITNGFCKRIKLLPGAAENIPLKNDTFDGTITAFGVRNFIDAQKGLKEMCRILKPNGKIVVLEFSFPKNELLNKIYRFYFEKVLPFLGRIISGHKKAYSYLPLSVINFPQDKAFNELLECSGFKSVSFKSLTLGIVTIYTGIKNA
tara:strand:+ start:179 stop:910 length:732 start_codon:yes stop_codon:yes gene_type:complete